MGTGDRIRVLIADDHALFRAGLREILAIEQDFAVVGEAGDGERAVSQVADQRPDVVLLDEEMPGEHVSSIVRRILQICPACRVIILGMYDGPLVHELIALGVAGYLVKDVTPQELVSAIRGGHGVDGRVVLSVSRECLLSVSSPAASGALSQRELQVLELASNAMSNAQIARRLLLTEATVKRHLRNIFGKLGATSRLDAMNKAVAAALLPPPHRTGIPAARPPVSARPTPTSSPPGPKVVER